MSAQHKERAITPMTSQRLTEQPFFGPKQAHHRLEVGTSGILYQLEPEGRIVQIPAKVDEVIRLDDKGGVIFAFRPVNYGPRVWATPQDLSIAPHEDGAWSANAWFEYGKEPRKPF